MAEFRIETERLFLREWRENDFDQFHAICTDPEVQAFLGPLQTAEETRASIQRMRDAQARFGCCMWAVERRSDGALIGNCGVKPGPENTPVQHGYEIGWRLARSKWGMGYAREAASATLDWAFANLEEDRIWSITVPANRPSWGLMERLGMMRHPDLDFDHPKVADDSALKRHITYSIGRNAWPPHR